MSRSVHTVFAASVFLLAPALAQAQSLASTDPLYLAQPATPVETPASSLDEPIEQIADTTNGCAVLDKDFPGLRAHPMYGFFKRMSLNQIAAMSKGRITPDMLTQAQTDLSALPAATPVVATPVVATPVVATPIAATPAQ